MKKALLITALFGAVAFGAENFQPIYLQAQDMIIATGDPSMLTWVQGSTHVPVWSLSGYPKNQSVAGMTPPLPSGCGGVKVEILVVNNDTSTSPSFTDVFKVYLSQLAPGRALNADASTGKPVKSTLGTANVPRWITLESWRRVTPGLPLSVRVARIPEDAGDTFERPAGLIQVKITPMPAPTTMYIVEDSPGYNSWPMIQSIGNKLVCTYSRGAEHTINEGARSAYARTSSDFGVTWTPEVCFAADPTCGEVMIGKGLDANGAALFWVRCMGSNSHHDLYRTTDGVTFTKIATPSLSPFPMQITDIFKVPTGLMCLWFATNYADEGDHSWGTLTSTDNGVTWTQRTIENLTKKADLPTEPSAVNLGNGRILAIARTEVSTDSGSTQFQLISIDNGVTWTKSRTNIRDVSISTPGLIYDPSTGLVSNYYYERGCGVLKRRVARAEDIFYSPLAWPDAVAVGLGESNRPHDSGNANATVIGDTHYISYYSGNPSNAVVVVAAANAVKK